MRIKLPKPFTFQGGERAVLLLHGFTGHSADVRMLGRYLEKKGYTVHAPQYKGHTEPFEELVKYGPDDWWQDALAGYEHLKSLGYEKIAVAGLSLGGVFSLKLGYTLAVRGIIPMCAPMSLKSIERTKRGFLYNAKQYKLLEQKSEEELENEMNALMENPAVEELIKDLSAFNEEVRREIDMIYAPILVVQAGQDDMIDINSANIIYDEVQSLVKDIIWYEESGHVITLDKERDKLHEDVYNFLEKLDWD